MSSYDFEQARVFFKAKTGFTTGLHEVDGMIKGNQDVVVVDVRLPSDFRQGHLPGAINLPSGRWHKTSGLSRDKLNVVYCYSQICHLAAQAALEFVAQGSPVMEMEGGFAGWQAAGYDIEHGSTLKTARAG
jgi:rhodanese-related sulfurtransferase